MNGRPECRDACQFFCSISVVPLNILLLSAHTKYTTGASRPITGSGFSVYFERVEDEEDKKEQAAAGFEPANNGFANRRLGPLGYAANL